MITVSNHEFHSYKPHCLCLQVFDNDKRHDYEMIDFAVAFKHLVRNNTSLCNATL